ncbi:lectin, mannose-binding 2-like b isoform X1 [Oncorhynchus nerka]|uniref:Lectin, mannose-binding 2-like b n=1 Tax=Oncorhynchus kisutch TaxID=8019 RepID=A0A8C7FSY5_ONCKI|nr:VIP36-like protein isoform X1 [Oncorhynchus kisutch]XP_029494110.1 VIP36-like protein isoform X1 [Oncorhynchus nerka]
MLFSTMNKSNRFRMGSFKIFDLMLNQRNIHELTCRFAAVLLLTCQCLADDGYEMDDFLKREYSLTKPYQGLGSSSSSYWDLMGNAMITTEHVRLTPDLQSRQGAVWSRVPCFLRDWELQVHFKIHGHGKKNLNGDGMALWYTKERMQTGPVFGNMNLFTGLGVFVDTYPNENKNHEKKYNPSTQRVFPYVSGMVGNGTLAYEHDRDGQSTELGGCTALVRNIPHDTFLLIRYTKNRLTIQIDVDGKQEWQDCLDLPGVRLPRGYFFGASSVTGDLSDNHDLISMKLYQLTVERTPEEEEEEELIPSVDNFEHLNKVEVQEEGMSGVQLFFTIVFSVIGIFVLGVVAVVMYGRWKENSRKRFY